MKSAARYVLVLVVLTFVAQSALAAPKAKTLALERKIGVTIYPGAKYLEHLAGMQIPGKKAYYFETAAEPRTVASFYMQRLHKKPGMFKGQNALIFPLSGKPPVINEYVSVEPNIYGGKAKTIITIVKAARKARKSRAKHK